MPTNTDKAEDLPAVSPADPTPETIYYNRYTGLACDKSVLSCRPISVCISNFDGKRQEGLSLADIIIETPYDNYQTRLWAIYTDHTRTDSLLGVSSVKNYMIPATTAFGAISAYAGNSDAKGGEGGIGKDYLDCLYHNLSSSFTETADGALSTSAKLLAEASEAKGYSLIDTSTTLPYQIADEGTVFTPSSNRIRSLSFRYSTANTVGFTYDEKTRLYLKEQSGAPHVDAKTGEQLTFSNLLLLFHNVSYYHTASETSFTMDTQSGGDGYLYTGGGVISVRWHYNEDGTLSVLDDLGERITVNRGKTYIGMLRVTDSATLVAK